MTTEHERWLRDNGEAKRLDYPLNTDSLYMDFGAYEGKFARKIYDKFKCQIIAYEPIPKFLSICMETLKNTGAQTLGYGLGKKDETCLVKDTNDATHLYSEGDIKVEVKDIYGLIGNLKYDIDLLKINIEGAEYDVLERMIETDMIKRVRYLQVQFHKFPHIDKPIERRDAIWEKLQKTHKCQWCYEFLWESWERK